ncbi:MAG: transcription termination factor Rho [Corynebacteriales bacterium]|nr:transcription termination factor Rho [Mycobacteriales bacterium]
MSDTTETLSSPTVATDTQAQASSSRPRRRASGLSGMLLPELKRLAGELGISVGGLRKGDLVAAIASKQAGEAGSATPAPAQASEPAAEQSAPTRSSRPRRRASRPAGAPVSGEAEATNEPAASSEKQNVPSENETPSENAAEPQAEKRQPSPQQERRDRQRERQSERRNDRDSERDGNERDNNRSERNERNERGDRDSNRNERNERGDRDSNRNERNEEGNEDRGNRGRNRRGRYRDRNDDRGGRNDDRGDRGGRGDDRGNRNDDRGGRNDRDRNRRGGRDRGYDNEPALAEDDVLIPVAGIIDILDNYAFVRTSGYLAGPNDVYVSLSQVRKNGLRRGDAVTGVIRQPREGERQAKYNPLVRLDSVNGMDVDQARKRSEFHKLTPLYPQDRLRLETEPQQLTTRVIDLVMPIGKGQRALIVSPPKAGKTMVLQAIANAITTNNPECHLMVVLVDERPEEVTDMQRSVKGEVVASTFDRPPQDHTTVAELSIERAKRLVELGHDVVVLLDSITRLGRAYNLAAPASGRILSGGVDSTALYPPKRFLGAARNIENGGSLTIIATALVETGSTMDTVIFEEFKGTGNAELKLDRRIADKRVFPAVDVDASGTRKEEILLAPEELGVVYKLRKVLHSLETQQALDLLLEKLRDTRTNAEFLMQIAKTTPGE